jgi:hypothetical protein
MHVTTGVRSGWTGFIEIGLKIVMCSYSFILRETVVSLVLAEMTARLEAKAEAGNEEK